MIIKHSETTSSQFLISISSKITIKKKAVMHNTLKQNKKLIKYYYQKIH